MRIVKIIIPVILVAFIGFLGWQYFKQPSSITAKEQHKDITTIVAFGDSLVKGVGATEGKDFVSDLSSKLDKTIINEGVSGETTAQGLSRIQTIIDEHPDMVIVLFGGNDALQHVDQSVTFSNLRSIIQTLQSHDITVVLLGIQGGALTDPYKKDFDQLAKDYKLIYVSNVLDGLFAEHAYMSDAVHPNNAGYAKIADRIHNAVKPLFEGQ